MPPTLLLLICTGILLAVIVALALRLRGLGNRLKEELEERSILETILDSVPGTLYLFDEDGKYLRWNHTFLVASGYSAEELAKMHPLDFFRGEDRDRVASRIGVVMSTGEAQVEANLVAKNGESTPYVFSGRRVLYKGLPVLVGMGIDISDRTRVEGRLRESEERFTQLTEAIEEVFWISDPKAQRAVYASPSFEKLWGRPASALLADPDLWVASVHPDDREAVIRALPDQLTGNYDVTYRIVRPDGAIRWIRDRAYPVRNATGEPYRIVGIAEDVTERRAIESQFLRAQRMESIGTLAGGVAHDLNNILTPILMSAELLRDESDAVARTEILDSIDITARKGAGMIRQLLQFARGIDGQRIPVDLRNVINDVVRIGNDTFLKSIQLLGVFDGNLPQVVGDPTQLHQVLLNLTVNARDAMPNGGVITITAREEEPHRPNSDLLIEVTDNGTGMPAEVVERVFEPFFTTKPPGKGTGLGLSTSHAIVTGHGGSIRVRSQVGEGSTFTIRLPRLPLPSTTSPSPTPRTLRRGEGELILVVDDEGEIRSATSRLLRAHGFRVMLATNGREAVEYFASHRTQISVLLTDMMMPVMDGATAIERIRALDPDVRVITTSGMTDRSDLPVVAPGKRQYPHLAKPYTAHELLSTINEVLGEN